MNTRVEIVVPKLPEFKDIEDALDSAEATVVQLSFLFNPFQNDSDIGRLNAAQPGEWVTVDPMTMRVAQAALRWHELSEGIFDPTMGAIKGLYSFNGRELTAWPDEESLSRFKKGLAEKRLTLDSDNQRIRRERSDVRIDFGGIAKGFAADVVAEQLRTGGIDVAYINLGGEIRVLGRNPHTEDGKWRIGLASPRPGAESFVTEISERGMASSGDYERYFTHLGKRYSHVIDPRTCEPASEHVAGVTVSIPNSSTDADALATILCVLGKREGGEYLSRLARMENFRGADVVMFVADDNGAVAGFYMCVNDDGTVSEINL